MKVGFATVTVSLSPRTVANLIAALLLPSIRHSRCSHPRIFRILPRPSDPLSSPFRLLHDCRKRRSRSWTLHSPLQPSPLHRLSLTRQSRRSPPRCRRRCP
jgi:hypothetical protein